MDKKVIDEIGADPKNVLKSVFGYNSFRPLQLEIITNVLEHKDTLAVMPTGGGKSLCYQIPALIFKGLTIVVSPLIALMEDQVSSLVENGVSAVFLNSSLEWNSYCATMDKIRAGEVKIVYIAPEGLASQRIKNFLNDINIKIDCITIDEAHCVSEWGHDFRPDYLEIAIIRKLFKDAVCLALTATATKEVRVDIIKQLELKDPQIIIASFNRPNIFLEVQRKQSGLEQVINCIQKYPNDSGIIYCFSRRQVDSLTQNLSLRGLSVLNYHAGLSDEERTDNQRKFIRDEVSIMVATLAFGMGINKTNVRYVIHYDMPKSLEQYYQEIGRAGRDGLPATALLLYSSSDIYKIRYFIDKSDNPVREEKLLQSMINFASSHKCRRHLLLSYFGENLSDIKNYDTKNENKYPCCDICEQGNLPDVDVTIPVQKLLSCILRTQERFGIMYVIDVLLGSRQKRIVDNGHNMLSTWGIGSELTRDDWLLLSEILLEFEYISKSMEYNVIHVTSKGREILTSRETIKLPVNFKHLGKNISLSKIKKTGSNYQKKQFVVHKAIDTDDSDGQRILIKLKEWRKKTATEENVPPYVILGDKSINDIAYKKPAYFENLFDIYGIGQIKAEKFGSSILRIVNNEY